ncbi:hypothetical protein ATI61_11719 [Archangium gephyra]|uniref:Outer membrane beta-barrel domain-containing protein n=1 Tax=Archangium gephyra TaxID=48 RepID=A0AAC8Q819_9BACT|nr:hypothetical protein [Archangium gephyra]AKJ02629.1 Hypothetical protein AA314_04255 [Archangium gephyra]REG23176.1 hypothetical protein ATI61_11719 [Archangium gephyra]
MKTSNLHSWILPCLLGGLTLATPTFAQDEDSPYAYPDEEESEKKSSRRRTQDEDSPYAYPDEENPERAQKRRRRQEEDTAEDFRRAAEGDEEEQGYERMSRLDDPNTGIAFEVLGGAMFLSSPRGQLVGDLLPAVGGRFTWEYGRLLGSEALREALWFDVRYTYTGVREGTKLIVGDTQLHYATIAPAYELTFGESSDYGAYLQLGGGFVYEHTTLEVGGKLTPLDGTKLLIQYGVGLRGRTKLLLESNVRLAWRVELMRFRRGYQDDTFVGASLGTAF